MVAGKELGISTVFSVDDSLWTASDHEFGFVSAPCRSSTWFDDVEVNCSWTVLDGHARVHSVT